MSESTQPTPTRRTVLQAAAWTAPVVAVASAVPFAAATNDNCGVTTIDFVNTYDRHSADGGVGTIIGAGGAPAGTFALGSGNFGKVVRTADHLTSTNTVPGSGIRFGLDVTDASNEATNVDTWAHDYGAFITVVFHQPVTDVSFTLYNLEYSGDARDFVSVFRGGYTAGSPGAEVINAGTTAGFIGYPANWYTLEQPSAASTEGDAARAVTYTLLGEVSSIEIHLQRPVLNSPAPGGAIIGNMTLTPNLGVC